MSTKTRFKNEAKGNSEMAYFSSVDEPTDGNLGKTQLYIIMIYEW